MMTCAHITNVGWDDNNYVMSHSPNSNFQVNGTCLSTKEKDCYTNKDFTASANSFHENPHLFSHILC